MHEPNGVDPERRDLSDEDILEAMRSIGGYLDITPEDFKAIYHHAYRNALERLKKTVLARQVMKSEVVSVNLDTPLAEAARLMAERGVSGVPVVDREGRVKGMLTEKDFLARLGPAEYPSFMGVVADCLAGKGCAALGIKNQTAGEAMTSPAVCVGPETPLAEIAALICRRRVNRLPVIDGDGRLVGILTRDDVVRTFSPEEESCPISPR